MSAMANEFVVIDVQGFKTVGNTFIVKEFCLLQNNFEFHCMVKSPFTYEELPPPYKSEAEFLAHAYHGLDFDMGTISLDDLVRHTVDHVRGKTVFVKGVEKLKWVREMYEDWLDYKECEFNVINIEDHYPMFYFHTKKITEARESCPFHERLTSDTVHCALSQARQMTFLFAH